MFNKIKKLAKKAKEALKHVIEKVEEYVMVKEEIELKKMELVVDTVKCAVKGTADTIKSVIKGTCTAIYDHPVVLIGLGVGLGTSIIIDKKLNSKAGV